MKPLYSIPLILVSAAIIHDSAMHLERAYCLDRTRALSRALQFRTPLYCKEYYKSLDRLTEAHKLNGLDTPTKETAKELLTLAKKEFPL